MTDRSGAPEEPVVDLDEDSAAPEGSPPGGSPPEGSSPDGSAAAEAAEAIAGLVEAAETEAVQAPIGLTEASLEALLFVAEKPLTRKEIARLAGVDPDEVDARLGDLEVSLRDRGLRIVVNGDRVELTTAPEAGRLIARYVGVDVVRLSPAALETLAIVAYRQPITRAAIERIRGVDSEYSVRTLLHRRLIVELGRSEAPGRPMLFGTGFEFLERFGLTSLDELPVLDSLTAERLTDEGAEAAAAAEPSGDDGSTRAGAGAPGGDA